MPNTSPPSLLAQRQFVRFWLARLGGITANQMLMVAVAWHIYDISSSAWDLGLVGLFQFVPALVMTLPAGHVADRLHRGRIFAACMAAQAAVALLLVAATQGGFATRELIFGVSVVLGVARAFQMPAQQALTPLLVPQALLPRAIAISSSGVQAAVICGPALGGVLYAAGASTVYVTCAVLLGLSCALTLAVRYRAPAVHRVGDLAHRAGRRGVCLAAQAAAGRHLAGPVRGAARRRHGAAADLCARHPAHRPGRAWGCCARRQPSVHWPCRWSLTRWPLQRRVGHKLLAAVAVFGLATVVFGLSTHFGLSLLALAITGAADNISVVTRMTLVQLETPDAMRGRVAAVNSIFIGASNQLGEFESGATAALFGPVGSVVMGGVGTMLVAALWLRLFPALARRDRMV